jgi:hypothetical protein
MLLNHIQTATASIRRPFLLARVSLPNQSDAIERRLRPAVWEDDLSPPIDPDRSSATRPAFGIMWAAVLRPDGAGTDQPGAECSAAPGGG